MNVDRYMQAFDEASHVASVRQVFGEPQTLGDKTIIPVAAVTYLFGIGFGSGPQSGTPGEDFTDAGGGGGGGGRSRARPVAVIEVTPDGTRVRPIEDNTRIALAGMGLAAWFLWNLFGIVRAGIKARRR